MNRMLTFNDLKTALHGKTVAIRLRAKLTAVDGDGGKIFPPTYAGGVYAVENRRVDGQVRRCVLLDSVQSQANRMEEVLQDAFLPNWRELPTDGVDPPSDLPVVAVHVENHGWITSLTAPHRIHDAILRDSNLDGTRFRDSDIGMAGVHSQTWDAMGLYRYCPTALLFGTWDSTAGEGKSAAKIPRAVVSEIVGVDMTPGVNTGGRLDPLNIQSQTIYYRKKQQDQWAFEESDGYTKGDPADINHGNIPPDMARFKNPDQKLKQLPDILESNPVSLQYDIDAGNGRVKSHASLNGETVRIKDGAVRPGGVTVDHALHTWTLSLTQLRRLRFPVNGGHDGPRNKAARTVLAALALYALALQQENGYWLRSRCELIPEGDLDLEFIGDKVGPFKIGTAEEMRQVLVDACQAAKEAFGNSEQSEATDNAAARPDEESNAEQSPQPLPNPGWEQRVIRLTPTEKLAELVRRSDARRTSEDTEVDTESEEAESASTED